jgi:hypothetical protein
MRPVRPRLRAKACRRHAVAPAKRPREVRRLAVAHEPRHVAHRDRRLLREQLRRDRHAPRRQVLAEARLPELRVCALQPARRARHRARDRAQRQRPAVVALDHDAREQVEPSPRVDRRTAHTFDSDGARPPGTRGTQA